MTGAEEEKTLPAWFVEDETEHMAPVFDVPEVRDERLN